ncbi:MAG: hypothetical protein HeimC3_37380 [Candidatus Heimdallarchaeota archaeon LC_3]|nr:MAG: hypothetical protein HeimC3_37380 [Candidatus Heimdallarchaeota archaeon LC_3]
MKLSQYKMLKIKSNQPITIEIPSEYVDSSKTSVEGQYALLLFIYNNLETIIECNFQ